MQQADEAASAAPPKAKPRRGLQWNLEPRTKKKPATRAPEPLAVELSDGWRLVGQSGVAFGQALARSAARAVRASVSGQPERPWAVRGEVPLDDERSACGCTTVVFGGVRMQMPEKIFGNNWLELRHAERSLAIGFDCAGALRRWAQLSLELVDDRRAGKPDVWSGWTCDAAKLRETWEQSAWGGITQYSRREEWDWAYRTDYTGAARAGAGAAGGCARAATALTEHVLIRTAIDVSGVYSLALRRTTSGFAWADALQSWLLCW